MKNIGHHIPHTIENMPKKPHTGGNDTLLPPPMRDIAHALQSYSRCEGFISSVIKEYPDFCNFTLGFVNIFLYILYLRRHN